MDALATLPAVGLDALNAASELLVRTDRKYVIHDPWDGRAVYVKASDLQAGKVIPTIAGWNTVAAVFVSAEI